MLNLLWANYADQPVEISIETFSQCNARCTFCPYPTLERIGTKLPDAVIERLIDEMAEWRKPFVFSPFKVNEPLLDKRLESICRQFNEKCPRGALRIFSNGSTLTEANLAKVAGMQRVRHLWVSLNTHDPAEYGPLMGLDFDQVTRKLDALHAREFPHPVVVSRVGASAEFVAYVKQRWPKFEPVTIKRDAWIDFTDPEWPDVPNTPCPRWWELNIAATGQAALCCMDGEAKYGFGNVHEHTLLEIYNHPTLRAWRQKMMSRKKTGNPCDRCSY